MKTKFLLLALLIVSASFSTAQDRILIPAGVDGKCGIIDQNGNWIINPQFDEINDLFWDEMVEVKSNGKWGYLNLSDNTTITPQYEEVSPFLGDNTARVKLNGKWRLIDKTGKTVLETQIEEIEVSLLGSNRAKSNGKWGYIDTNYRFVIEPQFEDAGDFYSCGLAYVKTNGKYGFIDTLGKMVIEPQFEEVGSFFSNRRAKAKINGKYGVINEEGQFIIEPKYEEIQLEIDSASLIVIKLNGKYGLIDQTGKTVVEPQYEELSYNARNGKSRVTQNDKYFIIDQTGKQLTAPTSILSYASDDLYENPDSDIEWKKASAANDGLAPLKMQNKYGYIDSTGAVVVKAQFDYAEDFYDYDYAKVRNKRKFGVLNRKTLTCTYYPKFEDILIYENIIFAKRKGKWGIVNEKGDFTVEPKFDWVKFTWTGDNSEWSYHSFK